MRVMPGDALIALMGESGNVGEKELAKLRKDLGLDKPYHEQYVIWLWQMVSFNPGDSIFTNEPIPVALKKAIPVTLELAALAHDPRPRHRDPDRRAVGHAPGHRRRTTSGRVVAVSGLSLPDFWLGTLVITFAAIWFHWIPPIGYVSFWEIAVAQPPAVPAAGRRARLPPVGGDHADDPLDGARGAARGLRAHGVGQGARRAASSSTSTRSRTR